MNKDLFEFHPFKNDSSVIQRAGEVHLNQRVHDFNSLDKAQFIILGISEDVGPRMNQGRPGAHLGFNDFLNKLLSVQSNSFLHGDEIGVLGELRFCNYPEEASSELVEALDEEVFLLLQKHVLNHQQLIVIGGGHNNALPLLRFQQFRSKRPVSAINIDPHADFRSTEMRHSGNPFSFAFQEEVINRYAIFGLHESYNNTAILDGLKKASARIWTYERYLDQPQEIWDNFVSYIKELPKDSPVTLDIDLDSIPFFPVSAHTPSGFTIDQIRQFIRTISKLRRIEILHLPEGAPGNKNEAQWAGKALTYFVLDFIKTQVHK